MAWQISFPTSMLVWRRGLICFIPGRFVLPRLRFSRRDGRRIYPSARSTCLKSIWPLPTRRAGRAPPSVRRTIFFGSAGPPLAGLAFCPADITAKQMRAQNQRKPIGLGHRPLPHPSLAGRHLFQFHKKIVVFCPVPQLGWRWAWQSPELNSANQAKSVSFFFFAQVHIFCPRNKAGPEDQ